MISEAKLKELIAQKNESRNLDYKEHFNWSSANNDAKCQLIKDILAFMNTEDGGVIIFGIHDKTVKLVGLTEDEFTSFDATKVNDLHKYTDPTTSCDLQKFVIGDQRVAVIGVSEFKDVPVICKRDANSSSNQSKLILKAGGLYIRTDKATSELISSAEGMRDLINRALLKRGDHLLGPLEAFIQRASAIYQQKTESTKRSDELREALRQLELSYDITLEALGHALDLNTAATAGHSKRVTAYTIALARAMGLSADKIRVIARGAFLHDIGKMAVSDRILRKPTVLSDEEFRIIKEHPLGGYQIVKRIPFLADAAEIVYAHHENFDGTGYPRGLKGQEIPVGARMVAIANTLDTMTSDQPYRAHLPFLIAKREIESCSGRQFDPAIVQSFVNMPEGIWIDLRRGIEESNRH